MVNFKEGGKFESFDGIVTAVVLEKATEEQQKQGFGDQFKITIDSPVSKKTGKMYEWLGISPTSKLGEGDEDDVAIDSILGKYLQELAIPLAEVKKAKRAEEALKMMIGKKFHFVMKKLGKAFEGKEAKEYKVPHSLIK